MRNNYPESKYKHHYTVIFTNLTVERLRLKLFKIKCKMLFAGKIFLHKSPPTRKNDGEESIFKKSLNA